MDNLTQETASASIFGPQPSSTFSLTFAPQPEYMLFKKLPGELRNEIIRLAVVEDTEIKPKVIRTYDETASHWTAKLELEHPLMQTCKQLRHESTEIYHLENTFHLTEGDFFTLGHGLAHGEPRKRNEKALRVLAHAFGPWASKLSKINVSHAICYDNLLFLNTQYRRRRAEVHVSVCRRAQGEPGIYLENARALDTLSQELCSCSVVQYAAGNSAVDIFGFVEGLVGMLDLAEGQGFEKFAGLCLFCLGCREEKTMGRARNAVYR
jgi:hypothetical protein